MSGKGIAVGSIVGVGVGAIVFVGGGVAVFVGSIGVFLGVGVGVLVKTNAGLSLTGGLVVAAGWSFWGAFVQATVANMGISATKQIAMILG